MLTTEEAIRLGEGMNIITPPPVKTWWQLLAEKFADPLIRILIIADVISFIANLVQHEPMYEPCGILAAILLATLVGFFYEMAQKKKFAALNKNNDFQLIKVRRDGAVTQVQKCHIQVGDEVILAAGDEICADMNLLQCCNIMVDESAMTGETVPVAKQVASQVLRGTSIIEGEGVGLVYAIGDQTRIANIGKKAQEITDQKTPLTIQLDQLSDKISKLSIFIGAILLVFLNVHHFCFTDYNPTWQAIFGTELRFFMTAVVIIIAAVPEGLPLSVVIALAYAVKAMMKDNNLVKKLKATETAGAVNIICTDKTGTLTQNRMRVVDGDESSVRNLEQVQINASVNSTAEIETAFGRSKVIGNPTEGAILSWVGFKFSDLRASYQVADRKPFNSKDKYMSTTVAPYDRAQTTTTYFKGAPEIILKMVSGQTPDIKAISDQQDRGRRAISFAHQAGMTGEIIYDGTLFIEDPVREDVPDAITDCYRAGVDVIMMTGDNIYTAQEIARQAGWAEVKAIEAKDYKPGMDVNVIARCLPEDKLTILKDLQSQGKFVAMTGDGVNDSPSLNHADVGFAMGSGTSVAKEASDIVLLDDAFPSIVKGIKWGRSLYKNIKSFIAFQTTINVALCLTALFGPVIGCETPFGVVEILYINLVMDALAALALASEPVMDNVLDEKPRPHDEFIINKDMIRFISTTGLTIFAMMTFLIGYKPELLFAVFMTVNVLNLFRARAFDKGISPWENLLKNPLFICVALGIFICNILIVQFGGSIFGTTPLDLYQHIEVGVLAFFTIFVASAIDVLVYAFTHRKDF